MTNNLCLDTFVLFMKLKENKSNCSYNQILIKTRKSYNYTQFFFYYTERKEIHAKIMVVIF